MPQLVESCGMFYYIHSHHFIKNILFISEKSFFFFANSNFYIIFANRIKRIIMRVLIVNTSEKAGGAAVAANRLMDALNNTGVKAKLLVRDKVTDVITVVGLPRSLRMQWNFLWERWCIFCRLQFSRKNLFALDIANAGYDITSLPEVQEADIIHLHWVNQGMLSLKTIRKIISSGKPVGMDHARHLAGFIHLSSHPGLPSLQQWLRQLQVSAGKRGKERSVG